MTTAITNGTIPMTIGSFTGSSVSGLMLVIQAMMKNYSAVQKYQVQQMSLAASLQKGQADTSNAKIKEMQTTLASLSYNASQDQRYYSGGVAADSGKLNVQNSEYQQISTLYSGLVSSANQTSADTTQTLQANLQMMGTNGVLAILQTLAAALRG